MSLPNDVVIQRARSALAENRALDAIAILEEASAQSHDSELLVELGHALLAAEQYTSALEVFDRAKRDTEESVAVLSARSHIHEALGRWDDAARCMEQAIELSPTSSKFILLAHYQSAQHKLAEASSSLGHALDLDPTNEEARFNLAMLLKPNDETRAERMLTELVRTDPHFAAATRELGFLLLGRGNLDRAQELLERAIALDATDAWASIYFGNLMFRRGNLPLASAAFRNAAQLQPMWGLPRRFNGDILRKDPSLGDPIVEYKAAFDADSTDDIAALRLGICLVLKGDIAEGRKWILRARSANPSAEVPSDILRLLGDSV